jgi:thiol-disulfide isomerase/thioredoxin
MASDVKRLIWFYGKECPHCRQLHPMVDQYCKENGVEIVQLEVWHNEQNAQLMRKYGDKITAACGGELGVPAFYNEKTSKAICGSRITLEKLDKWAKGQ